MLIFYFILYINLVGDGQASANIKRSVPKRPLSGIVQIHFSILVNEELEDV